MSKIIQKSNKLKCPYESNRKTLRRPCVTVTQRRVEDLLLRVHLQTMKLPLHEIGLQTHHVDSTLKRRGNDRFHVVST